MAPTHEDDRIVQLELDSAGGSAGVEREDVGDVEIKEPFDPRLIDVTTVPRTLDTLLKRLELGQIDLDPDFQRLRGIWTTEKKSQLIESLLLRIPLPTFYVAEIEVDDANLGEDAWVVVDGIQRLSTMASFVRPELQGYESFRLRGLQYLTDEEGKEFKHLAQSLQLRILESQFTFQVIRRRTPEQVKLNIFARINTGGVPLSAQELRHAMTPGQGRQVLKNFALTNAFLSATDRSVSPARMADREMALRYLAFRMTDPRDFVGGDFDRFLRTSMKEVNNWDEGEVASAEREFSLVMTAAREIFDNDAFRKRYNESDSRKPVNKALFESVSVALAHVLDAYGPAGLQALARRRSLVQKDFIELMHDSDFDNSISVSTGDTPKVRYRFETMIRLMMANAEAELSDAQ